MNNLFEINDQTSKRNSAFQEEQEVRNVKKQNEKIWNFSSKPKISEKF